MDSGMQETLKQTDYQLCAGKRYLKNKFNGRLAIIIYSCWKNRDMWKIFSILFKKYWKECPYKVVLVTDEYHEVEFEHVFDQIVQIDDTWAAMIKETIRTVKTRYVMLWMDDYLLCDYVSNEKVQELLERAVKYQAANLKLVESPVCSGRCQYDPNTGFYDKGSAYCLSTQIGIWDAKFLYKAVPDYWSAWEFERIGSLKKNITKQPILAALDYVFPYEEGVRKGKWMEQGVKLCKRNGIEIDTSVRQIMTNKDMAWIYFLGAVIDLNPTLILKIQNFIYKIIGK